ncbi:MULTISPECIES: hypothetical protein [Pseudomonadaceae]|uniref:Uncharacterized protein n=1 Tax=Ectopseudomonas toyotomiensis TaxID=554344 RepID=A0A1I5WSQ1_9GAMM|nr:MULTISPECIES: hypothetical protein [Pseudomonas]AQZ32069.1 hypothetical protein BHQ29_01395 [Pseudomonas sp. LPH1]MBG0841667.1 hypothetical protein [Pseudomonas toyotomiensis]MDH0702835.1 hypothetical protein [Pseudomonas toyotomiensis]PIA70209.1 hypothetical protein CDR19_17880 [Pseudomonas toyotomiensis]SDA73039.1 hypothetical protein SAMN03159475_3533 [Pseudomonas sp. NFPP33]
MLWTLLAIVVAGLGAAGIALLLRKLTRNKLPKWIVPLFGGLGMLGYQVFYEYSWFEHQQARQPKESVVVATEAGHVFWRPWSYFVPMITAFTVLDSKSVVREQVADAPVAEFMLYRFEKQHIDHVSHRAHLLNCATGELLPLDEKKQPQLAQLKRIDKEDALYRQVCR